ncbi:RPA-interacting protein [Clupea harengus]|uniref:RPA-interacting protein n=1 Tax=Clupea harengus TaxID=7950 RepID=A0A6P3W1X9_CLUHA|nr:RPA-interacting protein [Clupea harengus]
MEALKHRTRYGPPVPWKETYRKRCFERLKTGRSRLLERYRQAGDSDGTGKGSMVEEIMQEEWSTLQSSEGRLASPWNNVGRDLFGAVHQDDEFSVLQEIQQELLAEELAILEDYHRNMQFEEQALNALVEGMEDCGLIICPVCFANNMTVTSHFISCPCGLYINTLGRNVSPAVLRTLLEQHVTHHTDTECPHNPVFSMVINMDSSSSLMASCGACDYLSVVL